MQIRGFLMGMFYGADTKRTDCLLKKRFREKETLEI